MKILFIDDETRRMQPYVRELEDNNHEVVFQDDADRALFIIQDDTIHLDLAVLDISMPPGKSVAFEDTREGFRTGLFLYERLRSVRPYLKVIFLTNVSDRRVAERFAMEDPTLCRFVRKPEALPSEFSRMVEEFLQSGTQGFVN